MITSHGVQHGVGFAVVALQLSVQHGHVALLEAGDVHQVSDLAQVIEPEGARGGLKLRRQGLAGAGGGGTVPAARPTSAVVLSLSPAAATSAVPSSHNATAELLTGPSLVTQELVLYGATEFRLSRATTNYCNPQISTKSPKFRAAVSTSHSKIAGPITARKAQSTWLLADC